MYPIMGQPPQLPRRRSTSALDADYAEAPVKKVMIIDYPGTCMTFAHSRSVYYEVNLFYFSFYLHLMIRSIQPYIKIKIIALVHLASRKST